MRLVDSAEELHAAAATYRRKPHAAPARSQFVVSAPTRRSLLALIRAGSAGSDAGGTAAGDTAPPTPAAAAPTPSIVAPTPRHSDWGDLTTRMVAISTIPFLFLFLPQLLKNNAALSAGHPEILAGLSWLGYLTGLGGNSLLLSYFATKKEGNAVVVQALGILSSFAVLTQIRVAGHMPRAVYAALAALVGLQAILTGLKLSGRLEGSKSRQQLWGSWQKLLGLAGLAGVPQVGAAHNRGEAVFGTVGKQVQQGSCWAWRGWQACPRQGALSSCHVIQ